MVEIGDESPEGELLPLAAIELGLDVGDVVFQLLDRVALFVDLLFELFDALDQLADRLFELFDVRARAEKDVAARWIWSNAVICPAFVVRPYDRWPRWVTRIGSQTSG